MDPRLIRDSSHPHGWIVRVDGTDQSYVDPQDPTYIRYDYVSRIIDVIDTRFEAGERITAIHVGGGGLSIPRYIAHTRPTSGQIVLEPDVTLTQAVREVAPLPRHSGIKVRAIDGRSGIAEIKDDYADLVVIDAFEGVGVPAELGTKEWFSEVRRVLHSEGVITMNLTDFAPFDYSRRVVSGIAEYFAGVAVSAESSTWKGRRFGNMVVSAGYDVDHYALTRRAAAAFFPHRLIYELELDRWLGKAQPYTDATMESSPARPKSIAFFE